MTQPSSIDDVARVIYEDRTQQIPARADWPKAKSDVRAHYLNLAAELLRHFNIRPKAKK